MTKISQSPGAQMIIVGGAPRSGTSLMQAILDSHTRISGGPEFDCLPAIVEARNRMMNALSAGRIGHFCDRDGIDRHFGNLIETFLSETLARESADFISEKTPANVLVFEELMEILPAAKFVEVIRDPRAVVSSMLHVAGRFLAKGLTPPPAIASLEAATATVAECIHRGYCAYSRFPHRVFRLRYEDLITDTGATTQALFRFLELDWQEALVAPGASSHPAMDAIRANDGGLWDNVGAILDPFVTSLEKWRTEMTVEAQEYVSAALADSVSHLELGYDLSRRALVKPNVAPFSK